MFLANTTTERHPSRRFAGFDMQVLDFDFVKAFTITTYSLTDHPHPSAFCDCARIRACKARVSTPCNPCGVIPTSYTKNAYYTISWMPWIIVRILRILTTHDIMDDMLTQGVDHASAPQPPWAESASLSRQRYRARSAKRVVGVIKAAVARNACQCEAERSVPAASGALPDYTIRLRYVILFQPILHCSRRLYY